MYDAIVVGARCAGSPTAMLLARAGYRVLLLDRAGFPSDTLSTHVIHQPGVAALARWGLLDALRATGCPPIDRTTYMVEDIRIDGCARGTDGQRAAYSPRRHILDAMLSQAAVDAGAEMRQKCRVTGLLWDGNGRVVGVEGNHDGGHFTERAALVIGADGMRSTVAQLVEAPYTVSDPRLTCAYYSYWSDLAVDGLQLWERPGSWVAAVPTHHDTTLVLTYFPQSMFDEIRSDAYRAHLERVKDTAPELYAQIRGNEPLERLKGTGNQLNFVRRASGPGWALVGDAGHHKDSITARGITDAFYQAESLVRHVGGELHDPVRLDNALSDYGVQRDKDLKRGYDATLDVAKLEPPHRDRLAILRAVQSDPELTSIYFDVFAGVASPSAMYTPRLLELLA